MLKSALIIYLLIFISSCNCKESGYGVVMDEEIRLPLDSVRVSIYLSMIHKDSFPSRIYTDKQGKFSFSHTYCSDYMIDFGKEGYIGHVSSVPKGDTIFLELDTNEEY